MFRKGEKTHLTYKLRTIITKEILLLWRDRASLVVLFLMPVILVLVVSLVQHNVLKTLDQPRISVLVANHDQGPLYDRLSILLAESSSIELTEKINGLPPDLQTAFDAVARGDYQFCLHIPEGTSARLSEMSKKQGLVVFSETPSDKLQSDQAVPPPTIWLYYDPVVQGAWRCAVIQAVQRAAFAIETKEKIQTLIRTFRKTAKKRFQGIPSFMPEHEETETIESPEEAYEHKNILTVDTKAALRQGAAGLPNAVQQNIPAWTLFGMFFIVVPLAGSLIRERHEGTLTRLFTLPVSFATLLVGKISAYIIICLVQCLLMLWVGVAILPLQGLPPLDIGASPFGLFVVVLCAAFAATGFGLLVGAVADNYEQGSMFGAVSVVIAAALGGIMVPVYIMPQAMQKISAFSPLSWGMDAFLELFLKRGGIRNAWPYCLYLFFFGTGTTAAAWWKMARTRNR